MNAKTSAMLDLFRDIRNKRPTRTSLLRVKKACRTLELDDEATKFVLRYLEYADHTDLIRERFFR